MALDFPDSPNDGDVYEGFVYSSNVNAWTLRYDNFDTFLVDYVVVAGGGGAGYHIGGNQLAGGGGAGGYTESTQKLKRGSYSITVGAGGSGSGNGFSPTNGSDSVFGHLTMIGGGSGGSFYPAKSSQNGGSGGGGYANEVTAGLGTIMQGQNGGTSDGYNGSYGGGGGGADSDATAPGLGSSGGVGKSSRISGTLVQRAGGGGGSNGGGRYGGGSGNTGGAGQSGVVNTGGGGGAGDPGAGGAGGSGIVIIRFPDNLTATVGSGLVSSSSTSNGYTVIEFTSGSDTVVLS